MTHRAMAIARPLVTGGAVGLIVFGIGYVALAMIDDPEFARSLTREDGLVETLGAASLALAAILQLALFWRSDVPVGRRLISFLRRNPFYLALAAALFVAFAEEVSWGQRIFGLETPEALTEVNTQGEINFHNLELFQGGALSLTRLWSAFWVSYCVVLPLSYMTVPRLRAFYQRISLPVPPLWVTGVFLGCYVAFRIFYGSAAGAPPLDANEAKESFLAVCFVVLGVAQLRRMGLNDSGQPILQTGMAARVQATGARP